METLCSLNKLTLPFIVVFYYHGKVETCDLSIYAWHTIFWNSETSSHAFTENCLTYHLILIIPLLDHTSFWKYSSISLTGKTSSLFLAHTFHVLLHNFETSTAKNKDTKYKRRYKVFLVSTNRHEKHTFPSYHIVSCRFLVKFRILGNLNHDTLHFNMIVV